VTAILGPSGCGKTTTLRMIAGFETPDRGIVRIGDRVVAGPGVLVPPNQRRVGMVFQQLALFPHLDVGENVAYGVRGASKQERRARVGELLDLVGLPGMERRRPDQLSGGEAQRVALARALAPRPAVVLLDEPFSSLDVALRAGLRAEVRRILRAAEVTTLLVTHDQDEALSLGDQVVVMFDGRVVQAGPPEAVYRRPTGAQVAVFLGDANEVPGDVRDGTLHSELGPLAVAGALADGPATALVRPEDIDLLPAPDGDGLVEEVDYFGHDQLVTVRLPSGRRVRARLHARLQAQPGSRVHAVARLDEPATAFPTP
ncbi:MAG: ABC transporter ATP-binding protein, partial [Actinobacteria bacterium]|nr:ABC transporter ATP-binding protein [Actinomycetota bacterium]